MAQIFGQAEEDLLSDANQGWGLIPGTQVLGGNNPYMGGSGTYMGYGGYNPGPALSFWGSTPQSTSSAVPFAGFPNELGTGYNVPSMSDVQSRDSLWGAIMNPGYAVSLLGDQDVTLGAGIGPVGTATGLAQAPVGSTMGPGQYGSVMANELAAAMAIANANPTPANPLPGQNLLSNPQTYSNWGLTPSQAQHFEDRINTIKGADISISSNPTGLSANPHADTITVSEQTANVPWAGTTNFTMMGRTNPFALANPDITVANTIAEQIAETTALLGSMGLTGATAQAAQQAMTASSGYITVDQIAGLQAAQQEQDQAEAAANAAAAAIAASYSEAQDYGGEDEADPGDTMAGFGTVSDEAIAEVMEQIAIDNIIAEALEGGYGRGGSVEADYGDVGGGGEFGGAGGSGMGGFGGWT